ncbi:MAG: GNAT family protein [Actinomycetota bacterium]
MTVLVSGADVSLRHPTLADRDEFVAAARRSRKLHHPWTTAPDSDEAFDAYVERSERERESCLVVTRNDDDVLVGVYNVSEIVRGAFQNGYLGYYAFVPHAGRGAMRAAMPLVFEHAFQQLGLHRLQADVQPGNLASRALLRATGWREEGFAPRYLHIDGDWRDHELYAITAEEAPARRT